MKINPGDFIKHEKFMDVCIKVEKRYDYGHGINISGTWYNLGFENTYPIGIRQTLNLAKKKKDIDSKSKRNTSADQWQILDRTCHEDACYRYSKWNKLSYE